MSRTMTLPDDKPRVAWAVVVRDVPRALGLLGVSIAALVVSGLLTP